MKTFETITLEKAAETLGKGVAETQEWCEQNRIIVFCNGKPFILKCQFENKWLDLLIDCLKFQYGQDWKKKLKQYLHK